MGSLRRAAGGGRGRGARHPRSLLVDVHGSPWSARRLKGQAFLFNYPYTVSPVFLIAFEQEVKPAELVTEDKQRYAAPAGVGADKSIVAFSAICATADVPDDGDQLDRPAQGRPRPAAARHPLLRRQLALRPVAGWRVIDRPAPQPLAAVLLEWDAGSDQPHAVGTRGGERFDAFFEKYATKLEVENGSGRRKPSGATVVVQPATSYSKQWRSCRA